jgi:hypothetical protein
MAVRFETTVYNEKGRKINVAIKDNVFSGMTYSFDTISLSLQYDSESQQGQERFTPIIGSSCNLSLLINNNDLETLLLDIGLAVEGRFTMHLTAYEDDNITVSFNWYGYIVTDLVQFEDIPLSIGYVAQISAIDGLGWLKTLDYKSAVGPYNGQDTVVQHILNCLNQLDFVQSELVANSLPVLHTVFNWNENTTAYSADNDYALLTVIQHRAFYHKDTKNNYIYQSCYDVLKKICQTFGARLIFSGNQYWFIQVNEYARNPAAHRYFKYSALGVQASGTFTFDFTMSNIQTNLPGSDLMRLSGGKWTYYPALKNVVVRYNHFAKQNLLAGVEYNYATNTTPITTITPTLDATNADARLSYTGILGFYAQALNPVNFEPFQFVFAVKVASIINSFPLQGFASADWTLGSGWFINNGILEGTIIATVAYYTTFTVTSGRNYYVKIKVDIENSGTLRLRLGGVTKTITESGDYDYVILSTNTDTLQLDSLSSPGFTGKIKSLQVKQENKYLKRNVTYTNGFNFILEAASWEDTFYEYEFNTETITADAAFVAYKTITFDTLDIPESAEYIWEMRLKNMRNEAGTNVSGNFSISYLLSSNYLEFLPTGAVSGQSDILEYGSDNDDKSSTIFSLDTYIGDGPSKTTDGGLKVLESGTYENSSSWDVSSGSGFNNVTQLLVNEVIRGQLTPKLRMVDMPFQNLSVDNPYLPHKVIEYSSGYYVFERGSFDLKTEIWQGDYFKIELDA